ncbi:hypothetical protein THAOC_22124 [Thalassiosira oceanica]|uniref:Uncharacterized protein n=1 Tax=Thalassiosira oceanica TaxID=159749 RepID=K0RXU3_THAOC|nr:hypothetical protein THAOC_22124 [Thalassiosira oceanica]|eukprot:EJK57800.1 hypothetical protein THAOC_22124 [Thalassiosira oceanica]
MANIGLSCTKEVAGECIPDQNCPLILILESNKAVDPVITDDLRLEVERRCTRHEQTARDDQFNLQHRLEVLTLATDGEESKVSDGGSSLSQHLQVLRRALEVVQSLRSIGRNKTFLQPAHPWVCYWKLVELGASLLDSFELEMDWFSTDVLHPPSSWLDGTPSGADVATMETRRDHTGASCVGFGPPGPGAPCLVLGPLPFVWANFIHEVGATQHNGSFDYML